MTNATTTTQNKAIIRVSSHPSRQSLCFDSKLVVVVVVIGFKPGFHKANFDHDNDQFRVKTKQLVGGMTAQAHNRFVSCVVSWSLLSMETRLNDLYN